MLKRRGLIVVIASILVASLFTVEYFASTEQEQTPRRIVASYLAHNYDTDTVGDVARYVKVGDLKPNSALSFLDPFGKTMTYFSDNNLNATASSARRAEVFKGADAFERYNLIRLPAWLGGSKDDLSSYRAYSSLDISIQSHCLTRYWPEETRWRVEDPCSGDTYRVWDGLVIHGPAAAGPVFTSSNALPQLRLAFDDEGYIIAHKLNNSIGGDGVVGEGRKIMYEQLSANNRAMVMAASEYAGYKLPIADEPLPSFFLVNIGAADPIFLSENMDRNIRYSAIEAKYGRHEGQVYDFTIRVIPLEKIPELAIAGDPVAFAEAAFAQIDVFGKCMCNTLTGSEVGRFYAIKYPQEHEKYPFSAMLLWGKSEDGEDVLLFIESGEKISVNDLMTIAKHTGIRKD
jgi:hypothetical protein